MIQKIASISQGIHRIERQISAANAIHIAMIKGTITKRFQSQDAADIYSLCYVFVGP